MTTDAPISPKNSLSRVRERAGVRGRARALRAASTDAERLLWAKLRDRRLLGFKFRRQHPVGPYFTDFACLEIGLVIELDGGQHASPDAVDGDEQRSTFLTSQGLFVLRFWSHEVLTETAAVLEKILQTVQTRAAALTPALSRMRERGQDSKEPS